MKRRVLSLIMALCMVLTLLPVSAFADVTASGKCGDNVTWTLDSDGVLTISGTGAMKDYYSNNSSPWYTNRYDIKVIDIKLGVTSIGWYAFYGCNSLTSVTIPDSVTSIGQVAFYGCNSLTSVTIPDSVTSIGDSAFYGCSSLTSVTIPDSVTSIRIYAFRDCSRLTSVTMPNSVIRIEYGAFYCCSSLTNITIPNSVTKIGDEAFYGCSSLTSVTIPDSVTSIGYSAFQKCRSLTSVTISDSVTSIGYSAFQGCSSLTSITIPDSVTSIGSSVFGNCSSLECVTIGSGVTSIVQYAFHRCSNLTSVTIPDSVTSIGDSAFYGCSSLTSITIPGSVTYIGDSPFGDCTNLERINVVNENDCYSSLDGVLFNKDKTTLIQYPAGKTSVKYLIPNSVTSIGEAAFFCCSILSSVTIPDSVASIGSKSFHSCSNLTDVYFCGTYEQWMQINILNGNEPLINATRHYHNYTVKVTAPTCTEQGYTTHTCNICGDSYVADYVDALGHNYVDGKCTVCGEKDPDYTTDCGGDKSKCASADYLDVPAYNTWSHKGIDFVISRGIMGSTKTDKLTFEPSTSCTRAMVVSILYRMQDKPPVTYTAKFSDVNEIDWFADAVIWAAENGVVSGYTNGSFGPNDKLTREQLAMILKNYTEKVLHKDTSARADISSFPDAGSATWSKNAVQWAVANGLISGSANGGKIYLMPQGNAARDQVASIFMRYITNIAEA